MHTYLRLKPSMFTFMSISVQPNTEHCNILILAVRSAAYKNQLIAYCLIQLDALFYLLCLFLRLVKSAHSCPLFCLGSD